jgi:hypothetical protein
VQKPRLKAEYLSPIQTDASFHSISVLGGTCPTLEQVACRTCKQSQTIPTGVRAESRYFIRGGLPSGSNIDLITAT